MSKPLYSGILTGTAEQPGLYTGRARALTDEELCAAINRQRAEDGTADPALVAVALSERPGVAYSRRRGKWVVIDNAPRE